MARREKIRAPTNASLPNSLRIPSNTQSLVKTLGRLSRQSLIDLILQWLDEKSTSFSAPFLQQNESEDAQGQDPDPFPAVQTLDEVRELYEELRDRKGGKREVIDHVLEGDWRHGITLLQLAMIDVRYIEDHPSSQKWTALRLARVGDDDDVQIAACFPRIHASTFLQNLQHEVSPLVKAHYYLLRLKSLPITIIRVFVIDSPYQYPRQSADRFIDGSRIIYLAFPDSCPFVYASTSFSTTTKAPHALTTDTRTLRRIIHDAIPIALSRPHERYTLRATSLTTKSLHTLLTLRGSGRTNDSNGAFSIFADAVVEGTPLDPRLSSTVSPEDYWVGEDDGKENKLAIDADLPEQHKRSRTSHDDPEFESNIPKMRKTAIWSRFGTYGTLASSASLDRLDVRLLDSPVVDRESEDLNDDDIDTKYTLSITFTGTDIVAGLRTLAGLGIVDATNIPSWMTGEEGVSVATIRNRKRIRSENDK